MTDLIRRTRGLGVALVVLALSAGVVLAGAPRITLVADNEAAVEQPTGEVPAADDPTDDPADDPSGDASDDASDDASEDADDTDAKAPEGGESDTHGTLVSEAAQMTTPPGFRNHGAFVSCVAKSGKDAAVPAIDPATLTPADCGLEPTPAPDAAADDDADPTAKAGKAKGEAKSQAGKAKGQAAKGKGKAKQGR